MMGKVVKDSKTKGDTLAVQRNEHRQKQGRWRLETADGIAISVGMVAHDGARGDYDVFGLRLPGWRTRWVKFPQPTDAIAFKAIKAADRVENPSPEPNCLDAAQCLSDRELGYTRNHFQL